MRYRNRFTPLAVSDPIQDPIVLRSLNNQNEYQQDNNRAVTYVPNELPEPPPVSELPYDPQYAQISDRRNSPAATERG